MEVLLSLLSGLAIAATLQLLLANLGIALGLTILDWSPSQVGAVIEDPAAEASAKSEMSLPVTHLLGAGVALTLTGVLFVAALLATEFSEMVEPRRGAIFGLILWSIYWLLLVWLSSTTLSNLANSIVGTAIAGGRRLFSTLRQVWPAPATAAETDELSILQELTAELSQARELREQLPTLLMEQRETLIREISDRTDLSPQQVETVVDDLAPPPSPTPTSRATSTQASSLSALSRRSRGLFAQLDFLPNWQQVLQQALDQIDLSDWDAETLWQQAQALLESEIVADTAAAFVSGKHDDSASTRDANADQATVPTTDSEIDPPADKATDAKPPAVADEETAAVAGPNLDRPAAVAMDVATDEETNTYVAVAAAIAPPPTTVVPTASQSMQSESATDSMNGASKTAAKVSAVWQDAEDYVLHSPLWALQPDVLKREFYRRLYDPAAAPAAIQEQIEKLTHHEYVEWLHQRGDVAVDQVAAIAERLSHVQSSVMAAVATSLSAEAESPTAVVAQWPAIENRLLAYLRYTNLDLLTPNTLVEKITALQTAAGLPSGPLRLTSEQLTRLDQVLSRRRGLEPTQYETLTNVLKANLVGPEQLTSASDRLERLNQFFESALASVDWSTVTLEDLKPDLQHQLRSLDLRGEIDWQALSSRWQLPQAMKADLVDWLQDTAQDLSRMPRRWAKRVGQSTQTWAEQLSEEVVQYFQFQDKSALQPQQIAADIGDLLKRGLKLLPSPADWPEIADLKRVVNIVAIKTALENRRDLTLDEVQQVVGWVETAWQQTTQQVEDWSTSLWQLARKSLISQGENLAAVRQQVVDQIADTQAAIQLRTAELKADVQRQADAARRQVAIAAWWLFLSLLCSGGSAAIAGWLAVHY